jgi:hypothetical protein
MDWSDLLPDTFAKEQRAWERRAAVVRAVRAGVKQVDIALALGVSNSRVHQLYALGCREQGHASPFERLMRSPLGTEQDGGWTLRRMLKRKRPGPGQGA